MCDPVNDVKSSDEILCRQVAAWEKERDRLNDLIDYVKGAVNGYQVVRLKGMALPHVDDLAVDRTAAKMREKLAKQRAKGYRGWDDPILCTVPFLVDGLLSHVAKGDPIDVANFAMFLSERGVTAQEMNDGVNRMIMGATQGDREMLAAIVKSYALRHGAAVADKPVAEVIQHICSLIEKEVSC